MNGRGFEYFAQATPETTAVTDAYGKVWTRRELSELINRLGHALQAAGLRENDALAIILPNCAEYLGLYLGSVAAGLSVVPINWHLSPQEIRFILDESGAKAVFIHSRLGGGRLEAVAQRKDELLAMVSIGEVADYTELRSFIAEHSTTPLERASSGRLMACTSASTGLPKCVRLPSTNWAQALARAIEWNLSLGVNLEDGNRHLCCSMLYHSAPLIGSVMALHMGHAVVLLDRWKPELLLETIERHQITTAFMVPSMFVAVLKLPPDIRSQYRMSSLRYVLHGGAPCPVHVKHAMIDWLGPIIWESYGAAEVQGTAVSSEEWLKAPGTVGKPLPGSQVKIVDENGLTLNAGQVGTVYLTPYSGDKFEYVGDPVRTAASYLGDFISAGDLGYVDDDGNLFLCGRQSDLIISSGMNIYPGEIEDVLLQHPMVADCAVIGVPHELVGEVPVAYVVPRNDGSDTKYLRIELLQFLGQRLAAAKLPKKFEIVEQLPRDPSGKLFKRRIHSGETAR